METLSLAVSPGEFSFYRRYTSEALHLREERRAGSTLRRRTALARIRGHG